MKHRRYRGREIERTEGFNIITNPNARAWEGKETFVDKLSQLECRAHVIRYFGGDELHYKGWRWPCNLAYKVRVENFKPSDAFITMVKQET